MEGRLKWYSISKGFGFVARNDGLGDAFLGSKELAKAGVEFEALRPGDAMSFDLETDRQGRTRAVKVRVLASLVTRVGGDDF